MEMYIHLFDMFSGNHHVRKEGTDGFTDGGLMFSCDHHVEEGRTDGFTVSYFIFLF